MSKDLIGDLAHALESKDAEIARLRQTIDDLLGRFMGYRKEAEADLAEALKVIEPFAHIAEHDIGRDESDYDLFRPIARRRITANMVAFRAAHAFHQKHSKEMR